MATVDEQSNLVLSTGTRVYTVSGVVGISDTLQPYCGYDQQIDVVDWSDRRPILARAERQELADHVIALWQKFAALTDEEILAL